MNLARALNQHKEETFVQFMHRRLTYGDSVGEVMKAMTNDELRILHAQYIGEHALIEELQRTVGALQKEATELTARMRALTARIWAMAQKKGAK